VIEVACSAFPPTQHNREDPERDDKAYHEKHFSSRHDLLPLLLLPAEILAWSCSAALIGIKSLAPGNRGLVTRAFFESC